MLTENAPATQRAVFDSNQWFTDMKTKALDSHIVEVGNGLHDDVCEWNIDLRLCHCHRRKRLAAGIVTAPALVYQNPLCEGCWQETYHDGDGFVCDRCHARFSGNNYDEPGEWTDEHASSDAELVKWANEVQAHARAPRKKAIS